MSNVCCHRQPRVLTLSQSLVAFVIVGIDFCNGNVPRLGMNIIDKLPCETCIGLCCGPVPITEKELKTIKKKIRSIPVNQKKELQKQMCFHGTCIFYDFDNNRCGIYSVRPEVCRKFGYHENLVCPFAPKVANKEAWYNEDSHIGLLSIDFTWEYFEKR